MWAVITEVASVIVAASPITWSSAVNSVAGASDRAGAARVDEHHRPRPLEVARFQAIDSEASRSNQVIRLAIEMTAAGKSPPKGREPVLPAGNASLRCAAVLGEEKSAAGSQHPPHLREHHRRVGYGT